MTIACPLLALHGLTVPQTSDERRSARPVTERNSAM